MKVELCFDSVEDRFAIDEPTQALRIEALGNALSNLFFAAPGQAAADRNSWWCDRRENDHLAEARTVDLKAITAGSRHED